MPQPRSESAAHVRKVVGETVRDLRLAAGLSQEELAYRAGLNRTYIGPIENGERSVGLDALVVLADALGVSVREFFTGT